MSRTYNLITFFLILGVCLLTLFLSGCTKPKETKKILTNLGYTDVKITGYRYFGCSEDDHYHTGFTADSRAGANVSGVVCSGFLTKGSTVRYD